MRPFETDRHHRPPHDGPLRTGEHHTSNKICDTTRAPGAPWVAGYGRSCATSVTRHALYTGFRASELLSLTWAEVDFSREVITVRAAYAKNGEARSVPMNAVLTETLKAIRITPSAHNLVFCSRHGTPYKSFRSAFERAVQKAELVDFTFHDLRHTFASRLMMAGENLPTVKELMGHKDISMTLRYTHLSSDHKRRAVRALEQFGYGVPTKVPTVTQERAEGRLQVVDFPRVGR